MPLTTKITIDLSATLTRALDLLTGSAPLAAQWVHSLANGTGTTQADLVFSDKRTIAAGANDDLDLSGSLSDAFGQSIALVKVKLLIVANPSTNNGNVTIGNASSNQFVGPFGAAAHTWKIGPGGLLVMSEPSAGGWTVTAGTGDILRVNNGGSASADVSVIIIGASA